MKSNNAKPLVTISTYEERQEELNKAIVMRDEVDHAPNGHIKTENHNQSFPTPPPPPQFANGYSEKPIINQTTLRRPPLSKQPSLDQQPPQTPTPDYDSTPSNTLTKSNGAQKDPTYVNGSFKGTLRRVAAASEMAKANGDAAELESIESFKLRNHSSPVPRPPSLYFAPQNSGPPTMKKTTRPVSVTIGEYVSCNGRKEPAKFDFISKQSENGSNGNHQSSRDENVSEMLRSELEKTLSRSNLKKINENRSNNNNASTNGAAVSAGVIQNGEKPVLQKTQSSNIERLASILQAKHNGSDPNSNGNGSISSSNRVSINFNNKMTLRKADSTPPSSTTSNGILKNGFAKGGSNGFGEKNITFGN